MRLLTQADIASFLAEKPAAIHFASHFASRCWRERANFGEVDRDNDPELAKSIPILNVPSVAVHRSYHWNPWNSPRSQLSFLSMYRVRSASTASIASAITQHLWRGSMSEGFECSAPNRANWLMSVGRCFTLALRTCAVSYLRPGDGEGRASAYPKPPKA